MEQPTAHLLPKNIDSGVVIAGMSHTHILYSVNAILGNRQCECGKQQSGFLTTSNRFVNRKEAMEIAKLSGQMPAEFNNNNLFSEDIFDLKIK